MSDLTELRAHLTRRIDHCRQVEQARISSAATAVRAELTEILRLLDELNKEPDYYAQDALERARPLTDEEKTHNLELLTAYTKDAHIPDGSPWPAVLNALRICASLWEPTARIQGNLRAGDIARACQEALDELKARGAK